MKRFHCCTIAVRRASSPPDLNRPLWRKASRAHSPARAPSAAASGVREFMAASDAIPVTPPFVQPGHPGFSGRESARQYPRPAGSSPLEARSILTQHPRDPLEASTAGRPVLVPDRRSHFEGRSPEVPVASASIAAPPVLSPTLPPKASGKADQRLLTPHPQPARQREVPPKDPRLAKAPPPSVSAAGIHRIKTPPAPTMPSPQQTEPQPETIIQIARVEIVASQPEPRRTVAPGSRKPTTSLADYLARRRR